MGATDGGKGCIKSQLDTGPPGHMSCRLPAADRLGWFIITYIALIFLGKFY